MNDPIVIVGSGASGVSFAHAALDRGRRVTMVDIGHAGEEAVYPLATFAELKRRLDDPVAWFLGDDYASLALPGDDEEFYGFPPTKRHVFFPRAELPTRSRGFAPLTSFARGGLAEAWTAGCYPFDSRDLADFPLAEGALDEGYSRVGRRIGISGMRDDLERFMPMGKGLDEPIELDESSSRILARYEARRETLNRKDSCFVGRARLAVLSRDRDGRAACSGLGRCLWGCPSESLYTPSRGWRELMNRDGFSYRPGTVVTRFGFGDDGRVRSISGHEASGGKPFRLEAGTLVLAAGTLSTARIVLESFHHETGEAPEIQGLMDNRQIHMPFVNLSMIGRRAELDRYQFHQLALGLDLGGAADYVHGLVTTLGSALIHPILREMPFSIKTSLRSFADLHAAVGLLNLNFADTPRETNRVWLEVDGEHHRLVVEYQPPADEPAKLRSVCRRARRVLRRLGCRASKTLTRSRTMGASVHYAGTFPMTATPRPWTCDSLGRLRGLENLILADGSTFPFLPAKNISFTLMANAQRIADELL